MRDTALSRSAWDSEMGNIDRPPRRDLLDAATLRQIGLSAATLQRTHPVYHHIFRALERAVTDGGLQPGSRLPERSDCKNWKCKSIWSKFFSKFLTHSF